LVADRTLWDHQRVAPPWECCYPVSVAGRSSAYWRRPTLFVLKSRVLEVERTAQGHRAVGGGVG